MSIRSKELRKRRLRSIMWVWRIGGGNRGRGRTGRRDRRVKDYRGMVGMGIMGIMVMGFRIRFSRILLLGSRCLFRLVICKLFREKGLEFVVTKIMSMGVITMTIIIVFR